MDAVTELLRSIIVSCMAETVVHRTLPCAGSGCSRYRELGEKLRLSVQEKIDDEYGLEIRNLLS